MRIDRRLRRSLRLQNLLFTGLVLTVAVLLGWLSHLFSHTADWTANSRHSLGAETRDVIELVDAPVTITAYVGPEPRTRRAIEELIERYAGAGLDVEFEFVNPETNPQRARELNLKPGGEVIVELDGRRERLDSLNEAELSNALGRLARGQDRFIAFVTGHGERDPLGDEDRGYQEFSAQLGDRGLHVQTHNLARNPQVPDNADLLVIAGPRSDYLPGEYAAIQRYLDAGRNLLWLTDPQDDERFDELAERLGVERLPGVVVDAGAQAYGAATPDFAVVTEYPEHAITRNFDAITVFPRAAAIKARDATPWPYQSMLRSRDESWNETGAIADTISPQSADGEQTGPLDLGIAASLEGASGTQRVAVVGDSDFLANNYLGTGSNLEFGMRLFHWLVGDDQRVEITPDRPDDIELDMSRLALAIIGVGFLFILPLALLATGAIVWWRRHKH